LGELGCNTFEIIQYGQRIDSYIKIIELRIEERKTMVSKNKEALKGFRKSNLFKVKTPAEKKATKFKQPSAHIIFHRNG
jgi:hypothetical protein